jgi:glycosyltransferase involved in cell wall biosynthesis
MDRTTRSSALSGPHRVLLIEANEDGTVGGSHQALYDLTRHLDRTRYEPVLLFYQDNRFARALRDEGFEVHVIADLRDRERAVQLSGARLRKLRGTVDSVLDRWRFLRDHRIDAVHINNSPLVGNDDWLPAARLRGIPILAYAMGDAFWMHHRRIHRWLARRFDRVLPISAYMTRAMIANGVDPAKLTPVHLGVDLDGIRRRVRRSREEVRAELGVGEDQLLLTMVGNVREWKGQHILLAALTLLSEPELKRLRVAFAGAVDAQSETYFARLRAIERHRRLEGVVAWLGARSDVPDLFAAADLAVHCSTSPEPFGLVVIEAMALGAPVVATNAGGPAEVVTAESGWLYDAGEPKELAAILSSVIADPALLRSRSAAALQRATDFSVAHTVAKTHEAYELTMGEGRGRSA